MIVYVYKKVSWKFRIPAFYSFAIFNREVSYFIKK